MVLVKQSSMSSRSDLFNVMLMAVVGFAARRRLILLHLGMDRISSVCSQAWNANIDKHQHACECVE